MAITVALLAALDVAGTLAALHTASVIYGPIGPGMSQQDVRYAMGAPATVEKTASGAAFGYRQGGGRYRVEFDAAGRFTRVTCAEVGHDPGDCPSVLGFGIGTGEDQIWYALGAPDRQVFAGDRKLISYDALGVTFTLRQYQVVAIALSGTRSRFAYLARLPRALLP